MKNSILFLFLFIFKALIKEGVMEIVVPGNFPIGCNSGVLATTNSSNKKDYDQFGCLKAYNVFITYYNRQLKSAIRTLRQKNKHVQLIYFDYYGAAKRLFQAPQHYGTLFLFLYWMNNFIMICFYLILYL